MRKRILLNSTIGVRGFFYVFLTNQCTLARTLMHNNLMLHAITELVSHAGLSRSISASESGQECKPTGKTVLRLSPSTLR